MRAYPSGEGSGDFGGIMTAEIRYNLPVPKKAGTYQLTGFYDAGHITLHQTTWSNSVTATGKKSYWLQGSGVGAVMSRGTYLNLKGTWAHTLGDNQGKSLTGTDGDGRSEKNRFWVQLMVSF